LVIRWPSVQGLGVGYIPVLVDPMGWHPEDWLLGGRAFRGTK